MALPNSNGMQLLLCYDNEGVYVNTYGRVSKTMVLQWGEMPTSVAYIGTGQIMGWGNKAIEIRSVESGHLDGVFMHKKAQRLKFLCERNDKVTLQMFISFNVYYYTIIHVHIIDEMRSQKCDLLLATFLTICYDLDALLKCDSIEIIAIFFQSSEKMLNFWKFERPPQYFLLLSRVLGDKTIN